VAEVLPPLDYYSAQASQALAGLRAGVDGVAWRFKWMHPRFRGRHVREVTSETLTLDDARLLVAREHAFDTWEDVARHCADIATAGPVRVFENAVEAVVDGDVDALLHALRQHAELPIARSTRRHHATLLHYLGANGVEQHRQRTPANALDVARTLLDAGASVDALADLYDERCTTLGMVVSSSHPAAAGLQLELALLLVERGAAVGGAGSKWQSAVLTALIFGYLDTARGLASHAGEVDSVIELAGLGRVDDVRARISTASSGDLHAALALAAQLGHADVVRLLLAHGVDPNRFNPDGYHAHATPLHQAVWHGHRDVVENLVAAGATVDLADTIYDATPLQWAEYARRDALADYLRGRR
jgi:Ankyrin repeats (3 copies)